MSDAKLELARASAEAFGQRDAEWFIANSTPDFAFFPAVMTGVEGQGSSVRGAEGIGQFFSDLDEPWESFRVDVDEYREIGEQVVCVARLRAKGRGSGVELDHPMAMALWFRDGKLARAQSFLDPEAALEAASKELEEMQ
jgi:ketosteroid isomerase-like protein